MSNYNWCHNPDCHTYKTLSRVRGTGDNKVLRTRKVKVNTGRSMFGNGGGNIWDYFCNHSCLMDFLVTFCNEIINIAPVREPKELPCKVSTHTYDMGYRQGQTYKTITVRENAIIDK